MESYQEFVKHMEEERAIKQQKGAWNAVIISAVSTTIGILLLVIGIAGYLANTEIHIEPDDFYGGVGLFGGMILVFGNLLAAMEKWV